MDNSGLTYFKTARDVCLKVYVSWLYKQKILQEFTKPENIPRVLYNLGINNNVNQIIEKIFEFLNSENIIEEMGSTYSLSNDLEYVVDKYTTNDIDKTDPNYRFVTYGLTLLEDRIDGGAGTWNLLKYKYLFERGYTQTATKFYINHVIDELQKLDLNVESMAIYGNYIEPYIQPVCNAIGTDNCDLITLTERCKDDLIKSCEFFPELNKFSSKIFWREEPLSSKYDLIVGVNLKSINGTLKENLNFVREILNPKGQVLLVNNFMPKYQLGIEPLNYLHPNYKEDKLDDVLKIIRSSNFSILNTEPDNSIIYHLVRA